MSRAGPTPRIPRLPARTLPVPAGTIASGVSRPRRPAAASRTLPSPPTTTTMAASAASDSASRVASSVPASIRGRASDVVPDGIRDRVHDAHPTRRIDEARRPRIDEDERVPGGVGRRCHRCDASRTRCARRHVPRIHATLALANDPQVTWEPGKLENRPARTASSEPPLPGDLVGISPEPGPNRFTMSFRARPTGADTARRAPTRRPGRKEHHCARYIWAHERSSRSPSRGPSSSASPRRRRPPPRPRRRPSRSSRSPSGSSVIHGITAPPDRPRSIAPDSSAMPSDGLATRWSSTPASSGPPDPSTVVQGARPGEPHQPEGR